MPRTARSSRSLGVNGLLPFLPRRAAATGTACSCALPPLRRRGGDGYSVVREKQGETRKGKLEGEGVEKKKKRRHKNTRAAKARTDVVGVCCCVLRLFITSIL